MILTSNYGLNKPEGTDLVDIDDINANADIVDAELKALADEMTTVKKSVADGKELLLSTIGAYWDRSGWTSSNTAWGNLKDMINIVANLRYNEGVTAGRSLSSQTVSIPYSIPNNFDAEIDGYSTFPTQVVGIVHIDTPDYRPVINDMSCYGNTIAIHMCNWTGKTISGTITVTVVGF